MEPSRSASYLGSKGERGPSEGSQGERGGHRVGRCGESMGRPWGDHVDIMGDYGRLWEIVWRFEEGCTYMPRGSRSATLWPRAW